MPVEGLEKPNEYEEFWVCRRKGTISETYCDSLEYRDKSALLRILDSIVEFSDLAEEFWVIESSGTLENWFD